GRPLCRNARSQSGPRPGGRLPCNGSQKQCVVRGLLGRPGRRGADQSGPRSPAPAQAPTPLMRKLGYGKGYRYTHDYEESQVEQQHLPDAIKDRTYYHPTERGFERTIKERLDAFEVARRRRREKP